MTPRLRYYSHIGLAAVPALVCGIFAVRLFSGSDAGWINLLYYLLLSTPLVVGYFWALRRLYGFATYPRIQWFMVRCVLVDVMYCLVLALFLAAMFNPSEIADFCAMYHVIWFVDLVLIGRYFTDLRPFEREQSDRVPWPHHDGKQNCPEAVFFKATPDGIGEIVSAGSSIRAGEEMPELRRIMLLALWGALLACLLSATIVFVSESHDFRVFPFMVPVYFIVGGSAAVILLVRKRICSFVGTLGAVQYRQIDADGECDEWSVLYGDFQHLKTGTSHEYFNGQYLHSSETRRFETADGSLKNEFCFHWDDSEVTRASRDVLPDVRAMFWQKIESIWAMRGDQATKCEVV